MIPGRPRVSTLRGGRLAFDVVTAAVLLVAAACATSSAPGPGPETPDPDAETLPGDAGAAADVRDAAAAFLEGVRGHLEAGRPREATLRADSLYFTLLAHRGVEALAAEALRLQARALAAAGDVAEAARRLAELQETFPGETTPTDLRTLAEHRRALGDDPGAAALLASRADALDDSIHALLRAAARSMSVAELRAALEEAGAGSAGAASTLLRAELAVALAEAGSAGEARRAAERALVGDVRDADRARARAVLEGRVAPVGAARVGLLLPLSGRYRTVGERIREGVEVALEEHAGAPPVQLSPGDEADGPAERLRELAREGVVAVVGPALSRELARAAAGRPDAGLLVLSPTAPTAAAAPNVYTLWDRGRREVDAAGALGSWAGRTVGAGPAAAVYPAGETGRRAYLAFRRGLGEAGGWLAASAAYDPEATTMEAPVSVVSAFQPRVVYAPGTGTTTVLQLAPQLSYYGLRGAVVAGGPHWSAPATLRRLPQTYSQFRVAAAFVDRERDDAWARFKAAYEMKHRRSLQDNILPALGHDAALLVLEALDGVRPPRPRAVARSFARLRGVHGATGRLRPDAATGSVAREVRVLAVQENGLVPVSAREVARWTEAAGGLETVQLRRLRARALQAVEEAGIPLRGDGGGVP